MSKHTPTPGPWTAIGREVRGADGKSVAWCGSFPEEEAIANARAIAAHHDLLDALRKAKTCSLSTEVRDIINAAIRKATGEPK